jgi:2-dehydropantoate 2-reductase
MHIGILGAGAIGCYLGGKLIAAGHDVVLVGRLGEEIAQHGLVLTDYTGARLAVESGRIRYLAEPAALASVETILLTVKSGATEEAARPLGTILTRPTPIVSFQNGVSNPERLRAVLPGHPVLAGMVPFNVARTGPGCFHNGTSGPLTIEKREGVEGPIAAALRHAGFKVQLREALTPLQWTKLVVNLNNAVNALAGIPILEQMADRRYRLVMSRCVREALDVLRAAGIRPVRMGAIIPSLAPRILTLPDFVFRPLSQLMVKVDSAARSSMLDDLDRRRMTEIDHLNGEIIRLAERYGVDAPVNRTITGLVKAAEVARAGSPRISSERLLSLIA